MNWHQVIEERSYELHQVVADVLRREPAKLQLVVAWIDQRLADPDYSDHSKDALSEWLELIRSRGLPGVLEKLADRSEDGVRMRHSSPFTARPTLDALGYFHFAPRQHHRNLGGPLGRCELAQLSELLV